MVLKHHEYQIYYGGFKIKLKRMYFCEDCNDVMTHIIHQIRLQHDHNLKKSVNHKKQTGNSGALSIKDFNGLLRKHVIQEKN